MPAKDRLHSAVKQALIKAGWVIVQDQVYFSDGERHIWIDLSIRRDNEQNLILVEVKGFENRSSELDMLMDAVGQIVYYKAMLQYLRQSYPLYLAIPLNAYEGIFQTPAVKQLIKNEAIQLIVFDPESEEIVKCLP